MEKCVISVGMSESISFHQNTNDRLFHSIPLPSGSMPINCVERLSKSSIVVGGKDKVIRIFDVNSNNETIELSDHEEPIQCLKIYPSPEKPELLISGSQDRYVKIWNLKRKRCTYTLAEHYGWITDLCLLGSNRNAIASASFDKKIKIWDIFKGKSISQILPATRLFQKAHIRRINSIKYCEDRSLLYSGSSDRSIKCFDVRDLRLVNDSCCVMDLKNKSQVTSIEFYENFVLAGSENGELTLFDERNPKSAIFEKKVHESMIWEIRFLMTSLIRGNSFGKNIPKFWTCSSDCTMKKFRMDDHGDSYGGVDVKNPVYSILPMENFSREKAMARVDEKDRVSFLLREDEMEKDTVINIRGIMIEFDKYLL